MPKKFKEENSKSKKARERKEEAKEKIERERKAKADDEYWRDDDRLIKKKELRNQEKELKEEEKWKRRLELRKMKELEEKEEEVTNRKGGVLPVPRLTRAQIQAAAAANQSSFNTTKRSEKEQDDDLASRAGSSLPLTNPNKLKDEAENELEGRSVDAAILVMNELTSSGSEQQQQAPDRHPEKRMRAAYAKFEAENLTQLKSQHPTLRLSQLKQILAKKWASSIDNPKN